MGVGHTQTIHRKGAWVANNNEPRCPATPASRELQITPTARRPSALSMWPSVRAPDSTSIGTDTGEGRRRAAGRSVTDARWKAVSLHGGGPTRDSPGQHGCTHGEGAPVAGARRSRLCNSKTRDDSIAKKKKASGTYLTFLWQSSGFFESVASFYNGVSYLG